MTARLLGALLLALAAPAWAATPAISVKESHVMALDADGKVYGWGSDAFGQLGQGRNSTRAAPAQVPGLPPVQHMSLGGHALAVDIHGQVWAWGDNSCGGQLGPREESVTSRPGRVVGVTGMKKVAVGSCFSLALKADGTVWGWGLIPLPTLEVTGVRQIEGLSGIVDISAGNGHHVLALRGDGRVVAFGNNTNGELGLGSVSLRAAPTVIPSLSGVSAVAAGIGASLALVGGTPYAWGRLASDAQPTPQPIPGLGGAATSISLHTSYPYASRADGTVWYFEPYGATWSQRPGFAGIAKVVDGLNQGFALGITAGGQLMAWGENWAGQLGLGDYVSRTASATNVPGFTNTAMVGAAVFSASVFALKADGTLWFWGQDTVGESGDGALTSSSVPLAVAIPAAIGSIAAGPRFAVALDASGRVWGWGHNRYGQLGSSLVSPSVPTLVPGATGVASIAATFSALFMRMADNSVRYNGIIPHVGIGPAQPAVVPGMTNVVAMATGDESLYGLRADGTLLAIGQNRDGELGDGTTTGRGSAIVVPLGNVIRVAAGLGRTGAIRGDGTVWSWGRAPLGNGTSAGSPVPVQVPGINDAVDIAMHGFMTLVKRANGSVVAWGASGLVDAQGQNTLLPYPIAFHEPVQAMAAGGVNGFFIGVGGVAWGFGSSLTSPLLANVGDGTYVHRNRPVVLLAPGGSGSVDTGNWFLDLQPGVAQTIPATSVPRAVALSRIYGGDNGLGFDATMKYRNADLGARVNNYVLGLVPPAFFDLVKSAPGEAALARSKLKAGENLVLAQLTPSGWSVVLGGQLVPYSQAVANAAGGAASILNGTNVSGLAGARFCIGYGSSAQSMLGEETMREVLSLSGASASAAELPCVLTGVYVDGPASSIVGTPVTFNAAVVGVQPTGNVQFTDGPSALLAPVALVAANPAVAKASITTSALSAGPHSIGAAYSGDSQNAARTADLPLRHEVRAAAAGSSAVTLSGPASSAVGSTVTFNASVTGSNPTGAVQFRAGATPLGAPEPIVAGAATLRVATLGLGDHAISANYAGDSANAPSESGAVLHRVVATLSASVALASDANPVAYGAPVTLTATVSGNNPGGTVRFGDGGVMLAQATLAGGVASAMVTGLSPGVHSITATYMGDANNPPVTSGALQQQVRAQDAGTVPAPFAFAARGSARPGSVQVSGVITVSGISSAVPIVVDGGEYSIGCGATFVASPGMVASGQAVCVRHVASSAPATSVHTVLTIGGVSATFSSTTASAAIAQNVPLQVARYYQAVLGREGEASGKAFWEAEAYRLIGLGGSVNEVFFVMANYFFNSAEYLAANKTDDQFLADVYNTFFNRPPDGGGMAFWRSQIAAGLSREGVIFWFMFSNEFRAYMQGLFGAGAARPEVDMVMDLFRGLLNRFPETAALEAFVGTLRTAQCAGASERAGAVYKAVNDISYFFIFDSGEYAARNRSNTQYVSDMYNAFLRRGGSDDEMDFWIGQLNAGSKDRNQLRVDFIASPEFGARVNAVIAAGCLQ